MGHTDPEALPVRAGKLPDHLHISGRLRGRVQHPDQPAVPLLQFPYKRRAAPPDISRVLCPCFRGVQKRALQAHAAECGARGSISGAPGCISGLRFSFPGIRRVYVCRCRIQNVLQLLLPAGHRRRTERRHPLGSFKFRDPPDALRVRVEEIEARRPVNVDIHKSREGVEPFRFDDFFPRGFPGGAGFPGSHALPFDSQILFFKYSVRVQNQRVLYKHIFSLSCSLQVVFHLYCKQEIF